MANKFLFKRSSTSGHTPLNSDLDIGEMCINLSDGKVFYKSDTNLISYLTGVKESGANPTVNDDVTVGYKVGNIWKNATTEELFICKNNSDNAAAWDKINSSINQFVSKATNPGATNDITEGYVPGSLWYVYTTGSIYVCAVNTANEAVWISTFETNKVARHTFTAGDLTNGYVVFDDPAGNTSGEKEYIMAYTSGLVLEYGIHYTCMNTDDSSDLTFIFKPSAQLPSVPNIALPIYPSDGFTPVSGRMLQLVYGVNNLADTIGSIDGGSF